MGELVAGAGLGVVFQGVADLVKTLVVGAWRFKSTRRDHVSLVERVKEELDEEELDNGKENIGGLDEAMEEGEAKLQKYSNVPFWKCCFLPCYQRELQESIDKIKNVLPLAKVRRDVKAIWAEVNNMQGMQFRNVLTLKPPQNSNLIVGLEISLNSLKTQLLPNSTSVLVLTGLAGSGKTTLATLLCSDQQVKDKFRDNILFFQLPKTPDLKIVVRTLFEHYGRKVSDSDFLTDGHARTRLRTLLEERGKSAPIMVVLDNVWRGSESLIEDFIVQLPDYKLVVTSRVEFPRFYNTYRLKPLVLEDSVTLFRQFALPNGGTRSYVPDEDFVQQIADRCWGSPLALVFIGTSLCRQPPEVWERMRLSLSKGHSVVTNDDLRDALQKCLDDALEDEHKSIVKKCFMDLSLFPDNQETPVAALIDMWTELFEPDDVHIHEGNINGMNNIHELYNLHLINHIVARQMSSDEGNYYNHHFLVQHDLLREISIHQLQQQPFEQRERLIFDVNENNWPQQNQKNTVAHTLSISTDQMVTPDLSNVVEVEVVEVLILNLRTYEYSLPEFMSKMRKLKVLIVTGYNGFHFSELNNFEILSSLPSLRRIRLQQVSVPSFGILHNLRKLSLYMCNVGPAFKSDNITISNKLPNLVELSIDYCKDFVELPRWLCEITSLEMLSITRCIKFSGVPGEIGNLEKLKVLRISSCADLEKIPDSIGKLLQLHFLDISGCVSLQKLPEKIGNLFNLKKLHMTGCSKCSIPVSVSELQNLRHLICDEEVATFWENFKPSLPNLRIKEITDYILFI
ncbi:hypothetical protein VNO77_25337 [Canavalia gladiata]|uniref:Uncharacterized protein n=1 Tax=Canavalia gladiata TaxID=3824 RepID=A0AAN9LBD2_CANGL